MNYSSDNPLTKIIGTENMARAIIAFYYADFLSKAQVVLVKTDSQTEDTTEAVYEYPMQLTYTDILEKLKSLENREHYGIACNGQISDLKECNAFLYAGHTKYEKDLYTVNISVTESYDIVDASAYKNTLSTAERELRENLLIETIEKSLSR